MKRIKKILINGLLDQYDYKLDLRVDERVTMIYAPNGSGKTKLLALINAVFSNDFQTLYEIPFDTIYFEFTDNTSLKVSKVIEASNEELGYLKYEIVEGENIKYFGVNITKALHSLNKIERRLPFLRRIAPKEWYDTISNRRLRIADILNEYEDLMDFNFDTEDENKELIKDFLNVHFIETDRLYDMGNILINRRDSYNYHRLHDEEDTSTVNVYSQEIRQLISNALNEFASVSQELDRTFPSRVVKKIKNSSNGKEVDSSAIINKLNKLDQHRRNLSRIGLLDNQKETFEDLTENIDHYTASVLELYIEDTVKKLSVFEELEKNTALFLDIVNDRFGDKELIIDKNQGFIIKLRNGRELKNANQLSSGEQHALVMNFDLLFHSTPNTLVLIDEPEISLHIEWQQNYLSDLRKITELTGVDFIIATHSPDIMNGNWELSVPLQHSGGLHE
ncbi:hypothetical protein CON22_09265 [Bacillus cereus]|nr:hypothetical protein CON22_09265 [Bacillus cereus]